MNRGERIANRTKSAVKKALLELIREKNYPDITVGEITDRGDVGRSTLYRHYQSKADVMVDIHKDMFTHMLSGLSSAESWLNSEPPEELVLFFENNLQPGRNPFTLSYKLGNDLDYLMHNINKQLTIIVEARLRDSFSDVDFNIPLPILAQSVSSLLSGLTMSWFTMFQSFASRQFAIYIHRMVGALIRESSDPGF